MTYGSNRLKDFYKRENASNNRNERADDDNSDTSSRDQSETTDESKQQKSVPITDTEVLELFHKEEGVGTEDIDKYFGKFRELVTKPYDGSVLKVLSHHKVNKKETEHYINNVWWKKMVMIAFDDTVDIPTYVLYSLVLPHSTAVTLAEDVAKFTETTKKDSYAILSKMTGCEMETRKDFGNVLRSVLRRFPKVIDLLLPK